MGLSQKWPPCSRHSQSQPSVMMKIMMAHAPRTKARLSNKKSAKTQDSDSKLIKVVSRTMLLGNLMHKSKQRLKASRAQAVVDHVAAHALVNPLQVARATTPSHKAVARAQAEVAVAQTGAAGARATKQVSTSVPSPLQSTSPKNSSPNSKESSQTFCFCARSQSCRFITLSGSVSSADRPKSDPKSSCQTGAIIRQ